jgi:hypothetical protein
MITLSAARGNDGSNCATPTIIAGGPSGILGKGSAYPIITPSIPTGFIPHPHRLDVAPFMNDLPLTILERKNLDDEQASASV